MRSVIFSQRITRSLEVIKPDLGAFDKTTCKRVLDLLQPGDLTLGLFQCSSRRHSFVLKRII